MRHFMVEAIIAVLKGQCHEIFASGFFHDSFSPQPQSIPLGPFYIFLKIRGDIRKSRFAIGGKFATGVNDMCTGGNLPPVSTTPAANLPPVSTTPAANFATSFPSVVDTGGKFNTGGKFATGVNNTGGNLPPVSTTLVAICHRYQRHRRQICHRCQ
jgi:hypothetical protein